MLPQGRTVIGREGNSNIRIPFDTVSTEHLTINVKGNTFRIKDNNSTNGTSLDRG